MRVRRSSNPNPNDPFTLYVALDNEQQAKGYLYWDDGHTFSYQDGKYLVREFSYKEGIFSSEAASRSGNFPTQSWIERILVIGLSNEPIKVSDTNTATELSTKWEPSSKTLEVRKPVDKISADITLKFSF